MMSNFAFLQYCLMHVDAFFYLYENFSFNSSVTQVTRSIFAYNIARTKII